MELATASTCRSAKFVIIIFFLLFVFDSDFLFGAARILVTKSLIPKLIKFFTKLNKVKKIVCVTGVYPFL
jgi:hypothetical protein